MPISVPSPAPARLAASCVLCVAATLVPSDHAPTIDLSLPLRVVRDRFVRHIERQYLEALLAAHGGNVSAAARAAGVDRVHLHRLLKSAGLR